MGNHKKLPLIMASILVLLILFTGFYRGGYQFVSMYLFENMSSILVIACAFYYFSVRVLGVSIFLFSGTRDIGAVSQIVSDISAAVIFLYAVYQLLFC